MNDPLTYLLHIPTQSSRELTPSNTFDMYVYSGLIHLGNPFSALERHRLEP